MIPATTLPRQPARWQRELAEAVSDPAELARLLDLPAQWAEAARPAARLFGLRVPRGFVARMRKGDPADPLLRQVLPVAAELDAAPGFVPDPLQEAGAMLAPGLLRKYQGRALLVATGACGVHCRYCFRREFPYDEQTGSGGRWNEAVAALAADPGIRELILSGGDPLSLTNVRLAGLTAALAPITHLRMLRIHTRQPVVLPSRIDRGLLDWLQGLPWRVTLVLHANHPAELAPDVLEALAALRATGVLLLNQSVLLAGINDDVEVLSDLSLGLHAAGVLPYYLHLLDPVRGAAHFRVDESRGRAIIDALARRLPGFLVPRLARELPGEDAKWVVAAGIQRGPAPD